MVAAVAVFLSAIARPAEAGIVTSLPGFFANTLAANDDGSTGLVSLGGFTINFFGTNYTDLYVNNNGNVTFNAALATFTPFGIPGGGIPIIAPFFADVDTRGAGSGLVHYGTDTYLGQSRLP